MRLKLALLCATAGVWAFGIEAIAETAAYKYDSLGRVASAALTQSGTTTTVTYDFDAAGNRTQDTASTANQIPVANSDTATTAANTAVTLDPRTNDSDPNSNPLTVTEVGAPLHGTAVIGGSGTQVTYTPTTGFNGFDAFSYTISDGQSGSASATVSVTVGNPNHSPLANNDTRSTPRNTATTFDPRTNDSDPDSNPLTVSAVGTPSHGSAVVAGGGTQITYTPTTAYTGSDSFTYTISDGQGGTAVATVSMTVTPPNQNPVAVNDTKSAIFNSILTFDPRTNDSDPDSNPLTISAVSTPAHGSTAISGGTQINYLPATGYSGSDSFTYTISDGQGGSATATVAMTVLPANQNPVAVNDSKTTTPSTATTFDPRTNDSDPDGGTLSVFSVGTPSHGTAVITGGSTQIIYTPTTGYTGTDSFTYVLSDGQGGSATATVNMSISSNHNPVANDDSTDASAYYAGGAWVYPSVTFNPKTNDTDADGDTLTITGVTQGASGTVTFTGSSVTYTYNTHYHPTGMDAVLVDTDSFTYTISDGHGGTATATAYINVVVY